MLSLLTIDRNTSFFTVPIAFWLAHAPHTYAALSAGSAFNNSQPRSFKHAVTNCQTLTNEQKQRILRARNASKNGFETLALFAAAITAANVAGVHTPTLNRLSWAYVVLRGVYNIVYIYLNETAGFHYVRSVAWGGSVICSLGLFVLAGVKMV